MAEQGEYDACNCYTSGYFSWQHFGQPIIINKRHDSRCTCRWLLVKTTQSTTTTIETTTGSKTRGISLQETYVIDKNPRREQDNTPLTEAITRSLQIDRDPPRPQDLICPQCQEHFPTKRGRDQHLKHWCIMNLGK
jgi:hypothetical protein